ncbi:MAG: nickel pincer cofactor biosynthesis protein LarC [Planctomycetota bacterium]
MRIAYLDCASGMSGDMTLGALIDAGASLAEIQQGIDSLRLPDCRLVVEEVKKRGFRALQLKVEHEPEHAHRHLHQIERMIDESDLNDRQRDLSKRIFRRLGAAEAKVHGTTIEKVHFHEVGAVDSIADIVGAAIAFDLLGVQRIHCAPVPTGSGFIKIAHGRCSIPAPATAELLHGIPLADLPVDGELTTPTGAAIVAELAEQFGPLPAMTIDSIGYGAGQKDFDHANLLRLLVGDADPRDVGGDEEHRPWQTDVVVLLETNVDDAGGENLGHCLRRLREAGALDAVATPLQMKKDRPGVLISVQCRPEAERILAEILFCETTTLGMRRSTVQRLTLPRRSLSVSTEWGEARGMVAQLPDGSERFAPEYESCVALSAASGAPLATIQHAARHAFLDQCAAASGSTRAVREEH